MAVKILCVVLFVLFASTSARNLFGNRIAGGNIAPDGFAPFTVSLLVLSASNNRFHFCGGSLISTKHVLTAAHCIAAAWTPAGLVEDLRVLSGTQKLDGDGYISTVSAYYIHERYDPAALKNDIGILVLSEALELNEHTKLIPINRKYIGEELLITVGWGLERIFGHNVNELKYLTLPSLTNEKCVQMKEEMQVAVVFNISDEEICAYHSEGNGVCKADSGSALYNDEGLVGITSWSMRFCATGVPDVYARVSPYLDWIDGIVGKVE